MSRHVTSYYIILIHSMPPTFFGRTCDYS